MTEPAFRGHGKAVYARNKFLNNPWMQVIAVATNDLDFASLVWYVGCVYKFDMDNIDEICHVGLQAGGYTVSFPTNGLYVTVINITNALPRAVDLNGFRQFMSTVAHEIQHAVIRLFKREGVVVYSEEEPHAYTTGYVTENLMRIVARETQMFYCALSISRASVIEGTRRMPEVVTRTLSDVQVNSAIMDEYRRANNHLVIHDDNGWSNTSYFTGGGL